MIRLIGRFSDPRLHGRSIVRLAVPARNREHEKTDTTDKNPTDCELINISADSDLFATHLSLLHFHMCNLLSAANMNENESANDACRYI